MNDREITLIVDGTPRRVCPRPGESLLSTLREHCGITSVKDGCGPEGQCGACTAIVRGHPRVTCTLDGAAIITIEGLSAGDRSLAGCACAMAGAAHCGFCIPAIALHATFFLAHHASPTCDEIAKALDLHLCRCTRHVKILDAVELLAKARRGELIPAPLTERPRGPPALTRRSVTDRGPRVRRRSHARGHAPRMRAALRARVVAIDVSRAAALPGVSAIVTARDVPGERWYGLLIADWPGFVAVGEERETR
jgi:aerobic-type carbon monoxide dehydrogenase small subunit (CoxS/CutS family)